MSVQRSHVIGATRVIESCPGNGTRYVVALTPIHGDAAVMLDASEGQVLCVLWPHSRYSAACLLTPGGYYAPHYLIEKLRVNEADAMALSALLHAELGGIEALRMHGEDMMPIEGDR